LKISVVVAMFSTVTAPVLSMVSASSTMSVAAFLYGYKTTAAAHGQKERNDN